MPLAIVEAGRRVRLVAIKAGRGLQGRLASMGLVPGVEIEVLQNSLNGPCIVSLKGSRIILGRGMAYKIVVT
ncbi:MAG: ferrous iron transport protein A [Deltaproteobacteria bacterium]|nr:ferrous iron transport protein A [Deltaproteobacteria bacterium]MBW1929707.1 ferrous iron transport protein A [Deltaproteobacteria bacterium]MBW2023997.1 ferrous iron transport protein A [Deltaproteobacteria bacterium]MBW2125015.1 ferrous iron transport protein A [Deltaproteobacteria bacterium]RLB17273.1 MAG: hypothetical protein DRG63_04015 [Deltaproteobacteria bacterium]